MTTKNRAAVLENLAAEGIRGVPEKILDKADCARAGGKRALIAEYMENNALARGVFVDDVLANIRECEPLPRLRCLHAGWGYCDPLEKGLTLEEILKQIETS